MNANKIVFVALGILVILIAFSLFLSSFLQRPDSTGGTPPPAVPTQSATGRGQTKAPVEPAYNPINTSSLSEADKASLENFKELMPLENDNFAIDYSPYLNQFFVQAKTPEADSNAFLTQNGLLDLNNQIKDLFVVTTDSPKAVLLKAEDRVVRRQLDEDEEEAVAGGVDKEEDQMQPLADLFDKMMNLKFESTPTQSAAGDAGQLLTNPRLILSQRARQDLQTGTVDQRLINLLATLVQKYTISVGVFKTGHRTCVGLPKYFGPPSGCPSGHRPSDHYFGRGADIGAVNNVGVNAGNQSARSAVQDIAALSGPMRPTSVGQPWGAIAPGFFTDGDHKDHIHIGYR